MKYLLQQKKSSSIIRMLLISCTILHSPSALAQEKPQEQQPTPIVSVSYKIDNIENLDGKKSLMFNQNRLIELYNVLKNSKARTSGESYPTTRDINDVEQTQSVEKKEKDIIPPAKNFYLNSILYYGPDSWTIWINGVKTTVDRDQDNPQVIETDENNVKLVWQNVHMEKNIPNWQSHVQHIPGTREFTPMTEEEKLTYEALSEEEKETIIQEKRDNFKNRTFEWNYINPNNGIRVDSKNGIIAFHLSPHQSFKSDKLAIIEGKPDSNVAQSTPQATLTSDASIPTPENTPDNVPTGDDNFDNLVNDIFNDDSL